MTAHQPCGKSWTGTKIEHCPCCCESFGGTTIGDAHRIGGFTPDERRCLTVDEMTAKGWNLTKGVWHSPAPARFATAVDRGRPRTADLSPSEGPAPDGPETALRTDAP